MLLPYVECDARGVAAEPSRCTEAGVRRYPTWVIASKRFEGVMTLDELAKASGFTPPASP